MHVALYALLICVIWREQGDQGVAQSRVHEAAASCSVLCGVPCSWRNPQSRIPHPVMIVVKPVTLNSARNIALGRGNRRSRVADEVGEQYDLP